MNKGIVVVDVPKQCDECIAYCIGLGHYICEIAEIKIDGDEKPDWCPITPLPEKIQYKSRHSIEDEQFAVGWNACIDKIRGE